MIINCVSLFRPFISIQCVSDDFHGAGVSHVYYIYTYKHICAAITVFRDDAAAAELFAERPSWCSSPNDVACVAAFIVRVNKAGDRIREQINNNNYYLL